MTDFTGKIVEIDEGAIRSHLGEMVRSTVEETLNAMLDAEAEQQLQAGRYQRTEARKGYRSGSYERKLVTGAGEVKLKVPKPRHASFETAIIERYRRRETSVEEAMIEMYLAGVSVRRVEDITEALWGTRVSPSTVSQLNKKIYGHIERWRKRKLEGDYPYVFVDGIWLKRSWAGEVKNVSILVAIGVCGGYREVIGVAEGSKEDHESWLGFLRSLKERGLQGVRLISSDKCLGLVEAIGEVFPEAQWQRCTVHFYRNVFRVVAKGRVREVAAMLKAIHAQEGKAEARAKAQAVVAKLRQMKLAKAAQLVEEGADETLSYYDFPERHWRRIRTNNPLERVLREVRRRTRAIGAFPDGESALMLVAARLRHVASSKWGSKTYLNLDLLREADLDTDIAAG